VLVTAQTAHLFLIDRRTPKAFNEKRQRIGRILPDDDKAHDQDGAERNQRDLLCHWKP
jgi:hypothetical protein